MRKLLVVFSVCFLWLSCDVTKKYIKEGDALYAAGNFDDAANYYYNALLLKPENVIARQALEKSASIVLQQKISEFGKYVVANDAENAVKVYRGAQKYHSKVVKAGANVAFPTLYTEVYNDMKTEYINNLYHNGLDQMKLLKYDEAERSFSKIAEIDSTFKDVTVLRQTSIVEPMYQRAMAQFKSNNYKEAYRSFKQVATIDDTYKETKAFLKSALEKASVGVGIFTIGSTQNNQAEAAQIYEYVLATLVKSKSEFLQVVDRRFLDQFLKEQELGMNGAFNPEMAAKAGKLAGLKYVLYLNLSEFNITDISPKTDSLEAYEAINEQVTDPQTGIAKYITRFKKVKYANMFHQRKVYTRLFYQLISTETSLVVASDLLEATVSDEQQVSRFNGSVKSLYQQLPAGKFMPEVDENWRKQFSAVQRNLVQIDELKRNNYKDLAVKLAAEINVFIEK